MTCKVVAFGSNLLWKDKSGKMDWASAIFPFENSTEQSGFVRRIWRTRSVPQPQFLSVAVPNWEIVFVRNADGRRNIVMRGPETVASVAEIPQDAEFFGIQFELGVHMPDVPVFSLVDAVAELAILSERRFWLNGASWEIPEFENADVFARRLAATGALARDPVIEQTLLRKPLLLSDRTVQRRFVRSTGLTYGTVRQIEKAERAALLLRNGVSILDVVDVENYSDQAHLTRSLKRFVGQTPKAINSARKKAALRSEGNMKNGKKP